MGLFSKSPAAATSAADATAREADLKKQQQQQQEAEERLSLLIAGAPDTSAQEKTVQRFLRSNQRHCYVDGALGCAAYTYSALQHIHGQSNALTLLSMWAAGTTFLVNIAMRKLAQEQVAPSPEFLKLQQQKQHMQEAKKNNSNNNNNNNINSSGNKRDGTEKASVDAAAAAVTATTAAVGGAPDLGTALRLVSEQKANVFRLETIASWIWMLSSLQQFRVHKRLKWCGYSSWCGLGCSAYFTLRYMYGSLIE